MVAELLEVNALFRLRATQGVLGLADKHGAARLEAACALAVSVGDPSYRTIKGILAAGTGHQPVAHAARAAGDGGAAAHLHGPERLFADPVTTPGANVVSLTSTHTTPATTSAAETTSATAATTARWGR